MRGWAELIGQLVYCDSPGFRQFATQSPASHPHVTIREYTGTEHLSLADGIADTCFDNSNMLVISVEPSLQPYEPGSDGRRINSDCGASKVCCGEAEGAIARANVEQTHRTVAIAHKVVKFRALFGIR